MNIQKHKPPAALALLYPKHLAMLSVLNQETMTRAINNSDWIWIGDVNDEIFGFWGTIPPTICSDRAYLWFYSTPSLCKSVYSFVRRSREVTAELLSHYPILVGHGRADDAKSLRWLAWCGAQFGTPVGELIPFEIRLT